MGRWIKGTEYWKEPYRKVPVTITIPKYLKDDLDATPGKTSAIITEILETHKEAIGDGAHLDLIERRKQRFSLEVESILKDKLPRLVQSCIKEAIDSYNNPCDKNGDCRE